MDALHLCWSSVVLNHFGVNDSYDFIWILYFRHSFRRTSMSCIGDSHFCNATEFFCYRTRTAFVTEVTASPIDRILKHAVACEPLSSIVKNNTATLRWLKVGNFNEFTIIRVFIFNFIKIYMEKEEKMNLLVRWIC